MALGEIRAFDDDAVRVRKVLQEGGGPPAAAERTAQPDNGGTVAHPRLVLDLHHPPERREQLLDEVVLLVVQRRPAQAGDAHGARGALAVDLLLPGLIAGRKDPVDHHFHGGVQIERLPVGGVRWPIQHLVQSTLTGGQLEARRSLRAQPAPADRAVRIAFDVDDLLVADIDVLRAADRAVRTHRTHHPVGGRGPGLQRRRSAGLHGCRLAHRIRSGELPVHRPLFDPTPNAHAALRPPALPVERTYPLPRRPNSVGSPSQRPDSRLSRCASCLWGVRRSTCVLYCLRCWPY